MDRRILVGLPHTRSEEIMHVLDNLIGSVAISIGTQLRIDATVQHDATVAISDRLVHQSGRQRSRAIGPQSSRELVRDVEHTVTALTRLVQSNVVCGDIPTNLI